MKFAFITHNYGLLRHMGKWSSTADCIEAWCHLLDADHFCGTEGNQQSWETLNQYDVIMVNQNTTMYELTWKIKEHCPVPFLVGVADGCARDMAKFNSEVLCSMIRASRACDMYGSLVDWAVNNYQLITSVPVRWIGVPFYPSFFGAHKIATEQKNCRWPVIGLQNSLCNTRNGLLSLLVAGSIKTGKILLPYRTPGWDEAINLLGLNNVELFPYSDWQVFMERYSQAYFCVHLDTLYTWGRFPLDMAAMGIPVIGTDRNQTNKVLWPELTIDPVKEIFRAQQLACRLVNDKEFYTKQIESGTAGLAEFTPTATKKRLLDNIKELSNK